MTRSSVLFLMPAVTTMQSITGLHTGFLTNMSRLGFQTRAVRVPEMSSELRNVVSGGRPPDVVHAAAPVPANTVGDILRYFPSAKLTVGIDKPQEAKLWEPALAFARAAVLPDRGFLETLSRHSRHFAAMNRIEALERAGALYFISAGIDLKAFDPETDGFISPFSHKHATAGSQWERRVDPGSKAGNHSRLSGAFRSPYDKIDLHVVYVQPETEPFVESSRSFKLFQNAIEGRMHGSKHFIVAMGMPENEAKRIKDIGEMRRDKVILTADVTEELYHVIAAGAGQAVFFPEESSPNYASNEMIRGILTFMRYGTMPVVPNFVAGRNVVEDCTLPDGASGEDLFLSPTGFGFFYDPDSPESLRSAISSAEFHDYRTKVGHGIYSKAVPNAMVAAMGHGIDREAEAYAAFFAKVLGNKERRS